MDRHKLASVRLEEIAASLVNGPRGKAWAQAAKAARSDASKVVRLVCRVGPPTFIARGLGLIGDIGASENVAETIDRIRLRIGKEPAWYE